jgi:putative transposase
MVRARVVDHPVKWMDSGYCEIQQPPERYRVIDLKALIALCGFAVLEDFQRAHRQWVEQALEGELGARDERWSEAIAVGSLAFVEKVRSELGFKAMHRDIVQGGGTYALREQSEAYAGEFVGGNDALTPENTIPWQKNTETAET